MLHPEKDLNGAWDRMMQVTEEQCRKDVHFQTILALTAAYETVFDAIWNALGALRIEANLINYV